jgi:hypothetical protein
VFLCALSCGITSLLLIAAPASAFQPLSQRGTGTAGSGPGELSSPYQVAVDSSGNLFVGDSQNSRISEFAPNGSFVKAFGKDVGGIGVNVCTSSCQIGTDDGSAGSLCFPDGLAIDPVSGDLVIGDECNNRIEVFTAGGAFVRAFGKDVGGSGVTLCTTSCVAGMFGGGAGEFDTPVEIAIDAAGNIFVGDENNNRVDVVTIGGAFLRAFGADVGGPGVDVCTTSCVAGTFGGGAGELALPSGVALDGAGNVYVGEGAGDRISVFTSGGSFVRAFGANVGGAGVDVCTTSCSTATSGSAAGQLNEPFEVGYNPLTGEVLVPEFNNDRVSVYTPTGTFLRAFGEDVDPNGGTGFEICTATCKHGTMSGAPGSIDQPSGVTVDCRGTIYVAGDSDERVQLFGEPGVQAPPCGAASAGGKPSNAFTLGAITRNKKKGTATITVNVPNPGELTGSGNGVKASSAGRAVISKSVGAGQAQLLIKAKGNKKRKLNETGKVKLSVAITYTPTGGDPSTQSVKVKLKKRL